MQQCKTVTLRTRKCKNGMLSYYLDYYPAFRDRETMQTIRHESLHIYIYEKPKNNIERALNRNLTEKAETIRCMRYESIVNERFGLYDKAHKKESFLAYFKKLCAKNNQKWDYVYLHFYDYVNGKCTFEEVDVPLCKGFCEYLLDEAVNRRTKEPLSQNSVSGYWSTFRGMLRIAYRDKQIPDNINEFLDKVKTVESPKEVLTLEELYRLYTTPSENELIKRAALFSCLTGLRFSDVQALQWKNVCTYSDGGKYLDFISIKKKKKNLVPINKDVEKLMGKPGTGFVFKGLKYVMTQQPMKDWLADAKIQKHITFHCFRHTYASLQVELGTDIYTVQRILAHSNVATTEIYARHAEPKKREAAQNLSNVFVNYGQTVKAGQVVAVSANLLHIEVKFKGQELNPLEFLTMLYGNLKAVEKQGKVGMPEFVTIDMDVHTIYDKDQREIEDLMMRFLPTYLSDMQEGLYMVPEHTEQALRNIFTMSAMKNYFYETLPSMANPLGMGARSLPLAEKVQNLLIGDFLNYMALRHQIFLSSMSALEKKKHKTGQ